MSSDIQVVKGEPTPEELAALVIALRLRATARQPDEPETVSDWASYWRNVRRPLRHGPGRWRASAHPR
jgi:hypothetical protein